MTINVFRTLSKVIFHEEFKFSEDTLDILLNVATNGQMIPSDLIDKLEKRFDPNVQQRYFIEIFENLVKNNQNISSELSLQLEKALNNKLLSDQVLFIFVLQGQKENPSTMQQYLSLICSIIEKKDYFKHSIDNKTFNESIIPALSSGTRKRNGSQLEGDQKKAYELVCLIDGTDAEFLDGLADFDKPKLLKQNFDRI
ncbi:unnamed protein product, partial [Rotaria magnacalcarata]